MTALSVQIGEENIREADAENHAGQRLQEPEQYKPVVGVGVAAVRTELGSPGIITVMAATSLPKKGFVPERITTHAPDNPAKRTETWKPIPVDPVEFLFDINRKLSPAACRVLGQAVGEQAIGVALTCGYVRGFARSLVVPLLVEGTRDNVSRLERRFSGLFERAVKAGVLVEGRVAVFEDPSGLLRGRQHAARQLRAQLVREDEFAAIRDNQPITH